MERNFKLLKQGHPDAIEFIYTKYHNKLFWVGKKVIKDDFIIENILQDTFLKLWQKRDKINDPQHIHSFLFYVMKTECIYYYCRPRNKFQRSISRLELFDNYQEYMHGFNPEAEDVHLLDQNVKQECLDQILCVLPFLESKQRQLIELCLKNNFKYAIISKLMGVSVRETSNQVHLAIERIKMIVQSGHTLEQVDHTHSNFENLKLELTKEQAEIFQLRCEMHLSFQKIAEKLQRSHKEVHRQFMIAYKAMNQKSKEHLQSA
ncbi:RNA polymerase sigma factor, sigma-70 family [Zunongwangia mangrovi]|uniref:RNA polymerase sigma factor, sigma-70 family n=1 Tax=Zunongwangia mangrovi TaxID=1334022 RepID=A0A1I1IRM2_9FLAO|nr:sigma-70 family RNA polymerase sigma factor [Zunongwangia mangrovi]SFC38919.1 RNA polymerase sigma factor, sigma-70 family [Zunongwangia mangrovi]